MSKRAEEAASKAYPPETRKAFELLPKDWNKPLRAAYIKGYELAEKDLGWHPSTEHPPVDEEVIVLLGNYDDFPQIAIGHAVDTEAVVDIYGNPYKIIEYNGWNIPGVKYWMPMPKLPNEDE